MEQIARTLSMRDASLLLLLSLLWGGSFFFNGVAVTALPPLTIVFLRVALAAVTLWIIAYSAGVALPTSTSVWIALLLMGLLNNVIPFALIVWGQTQIPSGLASILNATTPLFTVLLAGILLKDEQFNGTRLAGVVVGFLGVVVMMGPSVLTGAASHLVAQLAIIGAAVSYSFAAVYGRRFRQLGLTPLITAAGQVTASAVLLLPFVIYIDQPLQIPMPPVRVWMAVVALAVASTAFAYILYFRILASAGAANLALVTLLIPVSAILLGYLVLGERLEPQHFAGMGLIAMGLLAIDGRIFFAIINR